MNKITKEEFADRVIAYLKNSSPNAHICPCDMGLLDIKDCQNDDLEMQCNSCWKQAIKQGVE